MGSPSGYTVCSWSGRSQGRAISVLLWCAGHSSFTDASMHTRAPPLSPSYLCLCERERERKREQGFGQLAANTLSFSLTMKEKSAQEQIPTPQRWTLENEYEPDIQLNLTKDFCRECQFDVCFFSTFVLCKAKGFCFRWVLFSAHDTSEDKKASSSVYRRWWIATQQTSRVLWAGGEGESINHRWEVLSHHRCTLPLFSSLSFSQSTHCEQQQIQVHTLFLPKHLRKLTRSPLKDLQSWCLQKGYSEISLKSTVASSNEEIFHMRAVV